LDEGSDHDAAARKSISRGKKRDRAEARSTFGGTDDQSTPESEGDEEEKIRQRMKRRTLTKKRSEVHSRGRKRDRDSSSHGSDGEEDGPNDYTSRKKRGKKLSEDEGYQGSDVSMDDSQISPDPLCQGRHIGEEWEVNDVQYKVGPNGDRLRLALVKKARSKFVMVRFFALA
jgi:hypothetical protein